jgi:hypothetical protein
VLTLFMLAMLAFVGLSVAAVVGFVFFLLKIVLWAVFFPLRLLFKLMWLPLGLAMGAVGMGLGLAALPLLLLVLGGVLVFGLIAAIIGSACCSGRSSRSRRPRPEFLVPGSVFSS